MDNSTTCVIKKKSHILLPQLLSMPTWQLTLQTVSELFFLFKKNKKKTKVLYPSLIQWNLCVVLEEGCWFMEAALISKAALNNLSKSSRCF